MKNALIATLAVGSVVAPSLVSVQSANALTLAPGVLTYAIPNIVFTANNVLDWTSTDVSDPVVGPQLGIDGDFNVTTVGNVPPFIDSGIFGQVPLMDDDPLNRQFVNTTGKIVDLFIDPAVLAANPVFVGGRINNMTEYSVSDLSGGLATELEILKFDTDGDGFAGSDDPEGDDFSYVFTSFTNTATGVPGNFDVRIDFEGFLVDGAGVYDDTPTVISFLNAASQDSVDTLAVQTAAAFTAGPAGNTAGADGLLTTVAAVPEPTSAAALGLLAGVAGLLKKRNKA